VTVGVVVGPDVGVAVGVEVGPDVGVAVGVVVGPDVGEDVGDGIDERAHVSKHAEVASVLSTPFTEHRIGGYRATHAQSFFGPPEEAATLAETGVGRLRGCVCAGAAHVT
jgi:hypothetical protein